MAQFIVAYSLRASTARIHSSTCPSAEKRSGFYREVLKADTVAEAVEECKRYVEQDGSGRTVSVCPCLFLHDELAS